LIHCISLIIGYLIYGYIEFNIEIIVEDQSLGIMYMEVVCSGHIIIRLGCTVVSKVIIIMTMCIVTTNRYRFKLIMGDLH